MRHLPEAPHDIMEYLFIQLIVVGKARRVSLVQLGMAPFSGLETRALAPLWHRLGTLCSAMGTLLYFQGCGSTKEKFAPNGAKISGLPGRPGLTTHSHEPCLPHLGGWKGLSQSETGATLVCHLGPGSADMFQAVLSQNSTVYSETGLHVFCAVIFSRLLR